MLIRSFERPGETEPSDYAGYPFAVPAAPAQPEQNEQPEERRRRWAPREGQGAGAPTGPTGSASETHVLRRWARST